MAWSATGGPLQISHGIFIDPFGTFVQPAVKSLGMPGVNGLHSGELIGSGYLPYNVDPQEAQRSSPYSSYLRAVSGKQWLKVYNNTLAEKSILDKSHTAKGLVVSSNSTEFTSHANKEVIICAGVFQSPQLLILSGIGPWNTLEAHQIPMQVELPGVGENLQDHPLDGHN